MNRQPIVERFITQGKVVENKKDALPPKTLCRAQYEICTVGKKNRNNRIYEKAVWEKVLGDKEIQDKLKNKSMFFHAEHPSTTQSSGEKIAGVVTGLNINEKEGKVSATMDVLETPYGQIVDTLLQAGCGIGVSTRADGELEEAIDEAGNKYSRVVPESYRFVTVDFTADPSNFGSELPMDVQRNVAGAIKAGLDNEKIDRQYATVLLEHLKCQEATTILESIKIDQHHEGCKCKATEKACGKGCPHAVKEAVKCPQCGGDMVGYKDGVVCPQCSGTDIEAVSGEAAQELAAGELPVAEKKLDEYIKKVGNEWQVTSKKGKNLGRYKSKAEAHKRLGQVEYFKKHAHESKVNEVEFTSLDSVLASDKPMSLEDLIAAVKLSMSAEFDATELYKKIAAATDDAMAKKVMQSVADEESVHAGEFRKLLATLDPKEEELEQKGGTEVAKETVTSSDISGQPADAKAAEEVMKKSEKRNKETQESTDPKRIAELQKQLADARRQSDAEAIKDIKAEIEEDVQLQMDIDPKVEQFLTDNWAQFIDDEDKVANLVKVFKITPAKAKEYIDDVARGKATMNAVYAMAESSWKQKAESLQEKVNQLNGVIEVLNESISRAKEKTQVLQEHTQAREDSVKKLRSQLDARINEINMLQEAKQFLAEEYEEKVSKLKEQYSRNLIKFYVGARTKAIGLRLSPKALTILESCSTTEEVDGGIRTLQNEIREAALQSGVPSVINVTEEVQVSPKQKDINDKVALAFRSFGA